MPELPVARRNTAYSHITRLVRDGASAADVDDHLQRIGFVLSTEKNHWEPLGLEAAATFMAACREREASGQFDEPEGEVER